MTLHGAFGHVLFFPLTKAMPLQAAEGSEGAVNTKRAEGKIEPHAKGDVARLAISAAPIASA